jgi:hypothetical protein
MKRLATLICFFFAAAGAANAVAADRSTSEIEGTYLLTQKDQYQRLLSFDGAGIVTQVSDQEPTLGFTSGRGEWTLAGADKVKATVVDFSYDLNDGSPIGPAVIVYELVFSDLQAGKYQKVEGSFAGKQFVTGQDPLNPSETPMGTFGIGFEGRRITAE